MRWIDARAVVRSPSGGSNLQGVEEGSLRTRRQAELSAKMIFGAAASLFAVEEEGRDQSEVVAMKIIT